MRRAASSDLRSAEEGQFRLNSRPCKLSRSDFVRGRPAFAARRSAYVVVNSVCGCVSGMHL